MFGSGPETSLKELSWINEPGSETRVKLASTEKPIPDVMLVRPNRSVPVRLKSSWELGALSAICPVPETNEENCKELLYPKAAIMVKESGEPTCCPLEFLMVIVPCSASSTKLPAVGLRKPLALTTAPGIAG